MDRKTIAGWKPLLPICLALAGCQSSTAPDLTGNPSAPSAQVQSEPCRLSPSVVATGFRAEDPRSSQAIPDPETFFGPPTTSPSKAEKRWSDAEESSEPAETAAPQVEVSQTPPAVPPSDPALPLDPGWASGAPPAAPELSDGLSADRTPALPSLAAGDPLPAGPASPGSLPPGAKGDEAPAIDSQAVETPVAELPAAEPAMTVPQMIEPQIVEAPAPVLPMAVPQPISPPAAGPMNRLALADQRPRSAEMDAISKSAEEMVQQGFRRAERGAVYSARRKFFAALSLVARAIDVQEQTQSHSQALVAGRAALVEAWDFSADGLPRSIDLKRIVATHHTTVLMQVPLESLSPIAAQQRYFSFAQEHLAFAVGREPAASMALFGLAKTARAIHGQTEATNLTVAGEQMACYQAALMVDERNFRATNELGVLLANHGRWEPARDLFLRTLEISETAATWRNLMVVWSQLGDPQHALYAAQRADKLSSTRLGEIAGSNLRWVDPDTFARSVSPTDGLALPVAAPAPNQAPTPATATPPAKKRVAQWPWRQETTR